MHAHALESRVQRAVTARAATAPRRPAIGILLAAVLLLAGCSNQPVEIVQEDHAAASHDHSSHSHEGEGMQHDATPPADAGSEGMQHHATPPADADSGGMQHGGHGGHEMKPIEIGNAPAAAVDARGNQLLEPTIIDGVKEYELTIGMLEWSIMPEVPVAAYAFNGQVPGPLIRVHPGDRVRFKVHNQLSEPTSVHWHGLNIPNDQDGAAGITQEPIAPGERFVYEFTVPEAHGTFFYHSHFAAERQQPLGMYGALIIEDPEVEQSYDHEALIMLGEWRVIDGETFPPMNFDGMLPNYFTINGKSYPHTETIHARVGERILVRFVGSGQFIHPMHIHGGPFEIVGTDGHPVPAAMRLKKDTILVGPGERYDVIWTADRPGTWLLHCHISHHMANDGVEENGGGGLSMLIEVEP